VSEPVLDVIRSRYWSFIPRRGSGRRTELKVADDLAPRAVERAREGLVLSPEELTALFAEQRPQVIEDMRSAADELRRRLAGDTVTFVVNRNINVSNVCVVGCAFCGFGQSKRSPDAYEHSEDEFAQRVQEAVEAARPSSASSPVSIPTGDLTITSVAAVRQAAGTRAPPACLFADGGLAHVRRQRAGARAVFAALREAGLGSTPALRRGPARRSPRAHLPQQAPVARWVEIIEASHAEGIRSTVTVMFGHIEEPWELASTCAWSGICRSARVGSPEFVPPVVSSPSRTLLGRTHGVPGESLARRKPEAHGKRSVLPSAARLPTCRPAG